MARGINKVIIVGDKINVPSVDPMGGIHFDILDEFVVEEYRFCLGFFSSENARKAGHFSPLCNLYKPGPDSEKIYISNYGEYISNKVPGFIKIED